MSNLTLTLETKNSPWIAGETPVLAATLKNAGAARRVPSPDFSSALRLNLTDLETGVRRVFTRDEALRRRRPDKPRTPPEEVLEDLPAGGKMLYEIDPDSYLQSLPKPGRWRVEATLGWAGTTVQSNPIDVEVTPLKPLALFGLNNLSERALRQVVLHGGADKAMLMIRESAVAHPGDVGYRRILEGLPRETAVALAMPTYTALNHLYAAAFAQGTLRIASDAEGEIFKIETGLAHARLHPFGWQTDHGVVEFLLLAEQAGGTEASVARADLRTKSVALERIPLPLPKIPTLWRVRRRAHEPVYRLVYGEANAIRRVDLTPNGATKPVLVTESPAPLCGLAFYPIESAPSSAVDTLPPGKGNYAEGAPVDAIDAVFGPFEQEGKSYFALSRLETNTGEKLMERSFLAPPAPESGKINWVISDATGDPLLIAAILGDRLVGVGATGPVRTLSEGLTGSSHLTLDWFGSAYVPAWISAQGMPVFKSVAHGVTP